MPQTAVDRPQVRTWASYPTLWFLHRKKSDSRRRDGKIVILAMEIGFNFEKEIKIDCIPKK